MIHLKLSGCLLKPPSTFKGFRILKSLDIQCVELAQDVLENMIVCCPLLERLTLKNCNGVSQLNFDAPNLQFLDVQGDFEDVSMVNMVNLADVSFMIYMRGAPCSSSKVINFFVDLPCIQKLQINLSFLTYLAGSALLEKLPEPCLLHLKFLDISIRFNVLEDILTALCLLRSSPALEKLEISTFVVPPNQCDNVGTVSSCLDDNRSYSFTQLRHVQIIEISGLEAELDFIRFLLSSSPVLETMTVHVKPEQLDMEESLDLVKKLLRLRRASANVEIIYLDK